MIKCQHSREQDMIDILTLEIGALKRDYTSALSELDRLSKVSHTVIYQDENPPPANSILTQQVAIRNLRIATRCALSFLGEIEERQPDLYPYS